VSTVTYRVRGQSIVAVHTWSGWIRWPIAELLSFEIF